MTHSKSSYSTGEVAKMLGTNVSKIGLLIRSGELVAINTALSAKSQRPRYRILADALDSFLTRRSTVAPPQPSPRRQRREAGIPQYF